MSLVESREKRAKELQGVLSELCAGNVPRWAGTPADDRAAQIAERELSKWCARVETQEFTIPWWRPRGVVHLQVGDRQLEGYPHYGSPGTAPDGIIGVLKTDPDNVSRFRIVPSDVAAAARTTGGPSRGETLAYLVLSPFGEAVPRYDAELIRTRLPVVGVSRWEEAFLREAAEADTRKSASRGELQFDVEDSGDRTTNNVIGTIPGKRSEEILLIAHHDCQYNSPGANDNAATLIVMFQLAEYFSRNTPPWTLTFLASGAEEIGFRGAYAYAEKRQREGTLDMIKLTLNFDSLTYGKHPHFFTTETSVAEQGSEVFRRQGADVVPVLHNEVATLDSEPFVERGIPSIFLNSRGDDESKVRLWHRPEDTPETVDLDLTEEYYQALVTFLSEVTL
ncbi:MAG: M28 family peptidase [Alkalispirochaeta sp.]